MNTTLTVDGLYEFFIEKLSQRLVYSHTDYMRHVADVDNFELYKPRTSWILKIRTDYDIEQRYEVSIHLNYTIKKYDKPRFKKDVCTRKK